MHSHYERHGVKASAGEQINLRNRLSRAHWCGCFSCTDQELVAAVRATGSIEVGVIGLYLATRYALESFDTSDAA
ncbi:MULTISPECIES: DUF3606 domain-containing protein [unclassified Rhodanobacter]|uniref:DUF3606 domain-containing protein n=1 Tax=Rhodanobacter humi TaxID=1888173 RepID=A0ABV4ASA6_9GAMM